jgi:hypothetical protein
VTAYARQKRYRDRLRAEGLCLACARMYLAINPRTGKPFRYCFWCRVRNAERYHKAKGQACLFEVAA